MPAHLDALLRAGSWQDPDGDTERTETSLPGGDVTVGVVRVGSTVRRPRQETSRAVAAYLEHLRAAGFDGAPRFLGTDRAGRDVLEYVPGRVAGQPPEAWVADERLLPALGALVRRLHEASEGFAPPPGARFYRDLLPLPPHLEVLVDRPTIVGHNDVTPQNVVVRDGVPVALVDFDMAGPTTPLRDVANTCLHWAPVQDPVDRTRALADADPFRRCRVIADGYGLSRDGRRQMVDVLPRGTRVGWHRMLLAAQTFGGGWARMWDDGVGDVIKRREAWLLAEGPRLAAALLD
ncbi:MAG: phosphotransferase enzyme family protein [Actinomycetes bacterium]